MDVEPDTKDWPWVLAEKCPECGVDAGRLGGTDVPNCSGTPVVGGRRCSRARQRPLGSGRTAGRRLNTRAMSETACMVYAGRLARMLAEEAPRFADWDQNVAGAGYAHEDPQSVAVELRAAAGDFANLLDEVPASAWHRPGVRSDGATFTVDTLARYLARGVLHHLWDVRSAEVGAPSVPGDTT